MKSHTYFCIVVSALFMQGLAMQPHPKLLSLIRAQGSEDICKTHIAPDEGKQLAIFSQENNFVPNEVVLIPQRSNSHPYGIIGYIPGIVERPSRQSGDFYMISMCAGTCKMMVAKSWIGKIKAQEQETSTVTI